MGKIVFVGLLTLMMISCQNNQRYSVKNEFENNNWNKFQTIQFEIYLTKDVEYQTKIQVEFLPEYEFTDLKLQYEFISPEGESRLSYFNIPMISNNKSKIVKLPNGNLLAEFNVSKRDLCKLDGEYKILIENVMPKYDTGNIVSISVLVESF